MRLEVIVLVGQLRQRFLVEFDPAGAGGKVAFDMVASDWRATIIGRWFPQHGGRIDEDVCDGWGLWGSRFV